MRLYDGGEKQEWPDIGFWKIEFKRGRRDMKGCENKKNSEEAKRD